MPRAAPVYRGYTAAELRAQYSAREAVPEHGEIFARWRDESAAFRARAAAAGRARLDQPYGTGEREAVDVFLPAAPRPAPLHVFLHGGYWQSMHRHDFSFVAEALTASGRAVAIAGYPLCPSTDMAGIVDSVRRAVRWLLAHGDRLGIRAEGVEISGHSAGGQLAALLAQTEGFAIDGGPPRRPIKRVLTISGVFDLEPLVYTPMNDAIGLTLAGARAHSPLRRPPASGVELQAWAGARESAEFRRQSREMVEHWRHAGAATCNEVADCNHFTVVDALFSADGPIVTGVDAQPEAR